MTSSLDRKLERATREAEAERLARSPSMTPERFHTDNHQVDGTVRPADPQFKRPGNPMSPKPQRLWMRDEDTGSTIDWVDDNEDRAAWYTTRDGLPPADDMSNVDTIRTQREIGYTEGMAAVTHAIQNDPEIAKKWRDMLVRSVLEHIGNEYNPVVRQNAREIAKVFMGNAFALSSHSELFAEPARSHIELKSGEDSLDALAYMMEGMKHVPRSIPWVGVDLAHSEGVPQEAVMVMRGRREGKSHLLMGLYHELQTRMLLHAKMLDQMLMAQLIQWPGKEDEAVMADVANTGLGVMSNGKRVDPREMMLCHDEWPSGNFGQRPKQAEKWTDQPMPPVDRQERATWMRARGASEADIEADWLEHQNHLACMAERRASNA